MLIVVSNSNKALIFNQVVICPLSLVDGRDSALLRLFCGSWLKLGFVPRPSSLIPRPFFLPLRNMENTQTLDLIVGGLAFAILIGAYLMMHTTVLTTKNKK